MRGRWLLAALAGASLVLICGGLTLPPAYAQDDPAAEADPNSGGTDPADQQATPTPAADMAEPAAAPADAAQPSAETQTAAPADSTSPSPDATPIVASIRGKLQDPAVAKTANAQDLAALLAFYGARSDPVWMTDMGFSSEAQTIIDEVLRADDWGLSSADFDLPSAGDLPDSVDDQALNEIKLDLAILKYARYARGGRTVPVQLNKLYGMTPSLRDPKTVLTEIADAPQPSVYLRSLHPKHVQFERLHQALLKARAESRSRRQASQYAEDHRQYGTLALDARKSRVAACLAERSRLHGLRRQGWQSDLPG